MKQKPHKKQQSNMESVCIGGYHWAWGLPWRVIYAPSDTPLEKVVFSLPAGINCK